MLFVGFGKVVELTDGAEGLGDHAVPDEVLEVPFWNRVSKVFNG